MRCRATVKNSVEMECGARGISSVSKTRFRDQISIEGFSTWTGELSPTARAQLAANLSLLGGNGQGGDQ